jgi:hypothetical protein
MLNPLGERNWKQTWPGIDKSEISKEDYGPKGAVLPIGPRA